MQAKRKSTCPGCGAMNAGPQTHCLLCYTALPLPGQVLDRPLHQSPAVKFCRKCGQRRRGSHRFCTGCGQPFQ